MADIEQPDLTALTVELLSAYVANNSVASGELAALIETTRKALAGTPEPEITPEPEYTPAVTVRKSLGSREHLLSMIDGKPYKTLKRHLSSNGLTPAEYRDRYNLPNDYPMVAPAYSEIRREVSVRLGLGRRPANATQPENAASKKDTPAVAEIPALEVTQAAAKAATAKKPRVSKLKALTEDAALTNEPSVAAALASERQTITTKPAATRKPRSKAAKSDPSAPKAKTAKSLKEGTTEKPGVTVPIVDTAEDAAIAQPTVAPVDKSSAKPASTKSRTPKLKAAGTPAQAKTANQAAAVTTSPAKGIENGEKKKVLKTRWARAKLAPES